MTSQSFSEMSIANDATTVSQYAPDEYEKKSYYNGIAGGHDHPVLVYRSDYLTKPFPRPSGRFAHLPIKTIHGIFGTPLNRVWSTVGPEIRDLIKARNIRYRSIEAVRFFTEGTPGEAEEKGPIVIWVGVYPESTSADVAHEASQEILALLLKNGVEGVVVEWREAVVQRMVQL